LFENETVTETQILSFVASLAPAMDGSSWMLNSSASN